MADSVFTRKLEYIQDYVLLSTSFLNYLFQNNEITLNIDNANNDNIIGKLIDLYNKYPLLSKVNNLNLVTENNTILDSNTFSGYHFLNKVKSNVTKLKSGTFRNSSIKEVDFPNLTHIGSDKTSANTTSYVFANTPIENVNFPACIYIDGSYNFSDCRSLVSFSANNVTRIRSNYLFKNCVLLSSVSLINLTSLYASNMFYGCTSLEEVSFPILTYISATNMFYGCTNLKRIFLKSATLCNLANSTGFLTNCPNFEAIYVTDDLVNSYKTHNVWKTFARYIQPISSYR